MKAAVTEAAPAPHVPPQVLWSAGTTQEAFAMYHIKTFNKISPVGLNRFDPEQYTVSDAETNEDGIVVRSAKSLDYEFPKESLAIARAGAGVNNIPGPVAPRQASWCSIPPAPTPTR